MTAVAGTELGLHRQASRRAAVWAAAWCAILGVAGGLWLSIGPAASPMRPPLAVAVADGAGEPPPIDQVPLLDEIGAEFLAETAAIAAEAVGLPRWNDLVDADAAFAAPGEDWPGPFTP
jgi:hypothetical protein